MTRRILAALSLFALAACGGGGGGSVPSTPAAGGGGTPVGVPTAQPSSAPAASSSARIVLTFPIHGTSTSSSSRGPSYVSPNAASFEAKIFSVDGASPPSWATLDQVTALSTAPGGNCTIAGGNETCTVTIPAPPGNVAYYFGVLDASGHVLSCVNQTITIVQGQNTNVSVTLLGHVASVGITGPTLTADTPIAAPGSALTLVAKDASGAVITGTDAFDYAYTLTDSDTTGATKLSVNGGTPASTVSVSSPTDVVAIVYSGLAVSPFTIAAASSQSGHTVTGSLSYAQTSGNLVYQPIVLTGTVTGSSANGVQPTDPNLNQPTLFFVTPGQTLTFTAAEGGWTDAPFGNTFTSYSTACGSGTGAIATMTPGTLSGGAQSFSATGSNAGLCSVTLTDGVGQTTKVWLSVTAANINLH